MPATTLPASSLNIIQPARLSQNSLIKFQGFILEFALGNGAKA
jgi:hypothetical protein